MHVRTLAGLSLAVALAAPATSSSGQVVLATTIFRESWWNVGNPLLLGYIFNVTSPFTVTHLAYYDQGFDGLLENHHVGIWSPTGQLLVDGIVPQGTSAPYYGGFRLIPVSPLTLAIGNGYRVAGTSGETERWGFDAVQHNAPGIVWTDVFSCAGAELWDFGDTSNLNCQQNHGQTGFYGGNFADVITIFTVNWPHRCPNTHAFT